MRKNIGVVLVVILFILMSLFSGSVFASLRLEEPMRFDDADDFCMEEIVDQIDEDMVYSYHKRLMDYGPRYTGSINCVLAGQYLYEAFMDMGLPVVFHEWKFDGFHSRNVVATLEGSDPRSHGYYVVSAHYDCTPGSLGADDDGSGVAAVLAIANVMSQYECDHSVRFVLFSGEEVGTYGSFCYARDSYRNPDDILGVVNLDMVGYANTTKGGSILRFHCPKRSEWMAEDASDVAETYKELLGMSVEMRPNYIGADHMPFINYGYDGVWIAHHDGYPWGNSPEDTPDHLNWTYQVKATRFLCAYVVELASRPIPVQVHLRTPYEGAGYLFDRPVLTLDCGRQWYRGLRGCTMIFGRAIARCEAYSSDPIEQVVFCIDDDFMMWDSSPPYEWRIQGKHYPPLGKHTLRVYAYTASGDVASDEMEIFLVTFSSQYGRF